MSTPRTPSPDPPPGGALYRAERLDGTIYAAVAKARIPVLDQGMRRLSGAADHGGLWVATAVVLGVLGGEEGRRAARRGLVSLGLASATANLVVKPLTRRRRPQRVEEALLISRHLPLPRSSSFPSGHTASAVAFAVGAGAELPAARWPLLTLAALVGYSRVHTGVHYPGDVAAGALVGIGAGWFSGR
jgi:membrane-associated phospholipid phosphatase